MGKKKQKNEYQLTPRRFQEVIRDLFDDQHRQCAKKSIFKELIPYRDKEMSADEISLFEQSIGKVFDAYLIHLRSPFATRYWAKTKVGTNYIDDDQYIQHIYLYTIQIGEVPYEYIDYSEFEIKKYLYSMLIYAKNMDFKLPSDLWQRWKKHKYVYDELQSEPDNIAMYTIAPSKKIEGR